MIAELYYGPKDGDTAYLLDPEKGVHLETDREGNHYEYRYVTDPNDSRFGDTGRWEYVGDIA